MKNTKNYLDKNKKRWDELVYHHINNSSYDLDAFRDGASTLSSFELDLLGDIKGKKILHLQCHFGMDTISLYREGAKMVVGIDFSHEAIKAASSLAEELDTNVQFIQSDVLKLDTVFDDFGSFDIVYTSYGTIVWLPELKSWGKIISKYLKRGGKFVFIDSHPFSHIFDDEEDEKLVPKFEYFQEGKAIHFNVKGSYATDADIHHKDEYIWSHTVEEIIMAIVNNGLQIVNYKEHDKITWKMFPFLKQDEGSDWYQIPTSVSPKIPLLLSIVAQK